LVYDGAPTVEGKGLSLAELDVRVARTVGRVVTAAFEDLTKVERKAAEKHRVKLNFKRVGSNGAAPRVVVENIVCATLGLDLELDTEFGPKTVRQLWLENAGHIRCQSPFRASV
jgi:hypothetical protein